MNVERFQFWVLLAQHYWTSVSMRMRVFGHHCQLRRALRHESAVGVASPLADEGAVALATAADEFPRATSSSLELNLDPAAATGGEGRV